MSYLSLKFLKLNVIQLFNPLNCNFLTLNVYISGNVQVQTWEIVFKPGYTTQIKL